MHLMRGVRQPQTPARSPRAPSTSCRCLSVCSLFSFFCRLTLFFFLFVLSLYFLLIYPLLLHVLFPFVNAFFGVQVLSGHTDIVRLLLNIDATRLVSGADDGLVIVWDRLKANNLAVLEGHTAPITALLLLEAEVLLSGSADRTVRMWSLRPSGRAAPERSQSVLAEIGREPRNDQSEREAAVGGRHSLTEIAGSSRSAQEGYTCLRVLAPHHDAAVKSLCSLGGRASFVSGGNDSTLRVWTRGGALTCAIKRDEDENLHTMLATNGQRLVTASDSRDLFVYRLDLEQFEKRLPFHRKSVRCLLRVSSTSFASASLDGAIVVWSADTLSPLRVLTQPEVFRDKHRVYISAVRSMVLLSDRYLAATIGTGFAVFDVLTGACVCDGSGAHDAECTALVSLYDGKRIISAGADAFLRMWGFSTPAGSASHSPFAPRRAGKGGNCALEHFDRSFSWTQAPPPLSAQEEAQLAQQQQETSSAGEQGLAENGGTTGGTPKQIQPLGAASDRQRAPLLLGEMPGHSNTIEGLLRLAETSFASSGADHLLMIWKDGEAESELRGHFAGSFVQEQYHAQIEVAVQESLESTLESSLPVLQDNHSAHSSAVFSGGMVAKSLFD
jgi:WD40 repeat protein